MRLEAFAKARPSFSGRVTFLGTSNRVAELLTAMDAYVLPSMNEGISNALLEAMATGLPVIASAVGGNPEVITDGTAGLLFAAGDANALLHQLTRLYERKELREQFGQAARQRVCENFSIDAMIERYEHLYETLIPTTSRRRPALVECK
jgi:glycosyltransferase involved in cell wall biosynthesis